MATLQEYPVVLMFAGNKTDLEQLAKTLIIITTSSSSSNGNLRLSDSLSGQRVASSTLSGGKRRNFEFPFHSIPSWHLANFKRTFVARFPINKTMISKDLLIRPLFLNLHLLCVAEHCGNTRPQVLYSDATMCQLGSRVFGSGFTRASLSSSFLIEIDFGKNTWTGFSFDLPN